MKYYLLNILFVISLSGFSQGLRINEVMYSNDNSLCDSDGDTPDWIELVNNSNSTINLYDFYLSDKSHNLLKYRLPFLSLAPNSFILIFASGKNKYTGTEIHSNFSLELMNDSLFLTSRDGILMDYFTPRCSPSDHSLGRYCDGMDSIVVFNQPTPGTSNDNASTTTLNFQADSISFSDESGFYDHSFMLSLTNEHPQNTIYFTTNSESIDLKKNFYRSPISIYDKTSENNIYSNIKTGNLWKPPETEVYKGNIIRARVYSAGCPASKEYVKTYFITEQLSEKYKFDCISVVSDPKSLFDDQKGIYVLGDYDNCYKKGDEWERDAHLQIFQASTGVLIDQDVSIRIHGRGTRGAPQKSLRLYAKEKFEVDKFYAKLFSERPYNQHKRLILRTTYGDWSDTFFKDELISELIRGLNMDYMDYKPVITFINGEYWGIQHLRERQDKYYLDQQCGIDDGQYDIIAYETSTGPTVEEGDDLAYNELLAFLDNNDLKSDEIYEQVKEMIDIDNCIDYFITEIYFSNNDFPSINYKMWKRKTENSKWRWLFFDCDGCMIRSNSNQLFEYLNEDISMTVSPSWSLFIFKQLIKNKQFKDKFYMRFLELMESDLSLDNILNTIDQFETTYTPSVVEHILRWNDPADINKWKYNVDLLRTFTINRQVEITKQLHTYFGTPFLLAPNPSKDYFNLIFSDSFNYPVNITIYNISGTQIFNSSKNNFQNKIKIDHQLNSGYYIVKVKLMNYIFSEKLIVIK